MPFTRIIYTITTFTFILLFGCINYEQTVSHIYHAAPPIYDQIDLIVQQDTIQFSLNENTYNEIKSSNIFQENGIYYISFYDQRSQTITIYYLLDHRPCRQITLKQLLNNRQLYKTSVYIKNWDSIFIINNYSLRLFDSSGHQKMKITFPTKPKGNVAVFDNHKQPILSNHELYAISRNRVDYRSLKALRSWEIMYCFDLQKQSTQLTYHLPRIYQENLYGDRFLEYNFCYNHRGKFVFSFPADTLLYETDLIDYYHSYFARSQNQKAPILPLPLKGLEPGEDDLKEFKTRDSYGPIFFDPIKKYYLRLVRHKISPEQYEQSLKQHQTVLIFNEYFQIIGESTWPTSANFESLFFTPAGHLYARTNLNNEYALQYVRFAYQNSKDKTTSLAHQ